VYGVKDVPGRNERAFYNPETRTALVFNSAFYPQLRALAMAMADDIAGKMFDIHFLAGACLDVGGKGIGLMAGEGSGFSTHLAGLLRRPEVKLHSYDGYVIRWAGNQPIADSVERKFLMPTDLCSKLPELEPLFTRSKCENVATKREDCVSPQCNRRDDCSLDRGKPFCFVGNDRAYALLDPYWIGGAAKHVKRSVMTRLILLRRDTLAPKILNPNSETALKILEEGGSLTKQGGYRSAPYYNPLFTPPHGLARSSERQDLERRFYHRLLTNVPLTVINTEIMRPIEAQETIWKIVNG